MPVGRGALARGTLQTGVGEPSGGRPRLDDLSEGEHSRRLTP